MPELADDPRFARNEDRTANREELRPLLVERLRDADRRWSGSTSIIAAGVPCGPINTVDGGVAFAEEIGLDPVVEVGDGRRRVPGVRNPITLLRHAGALRAAAARGWTSTARRSAGWLAQERRMRRP